ncbi:MAG: trehalose-phosphatase, partial [Acidimicrobiales bacterium]
VGEDGAVRTREEAEPWLAAVEATTAAALAGAPPGLGVEPKGLSLTLHWRRAPDTAAWAEAFAREASESCGLVAAPGRRSVELQPPVPVDKGTVVGEWCRGLSAAAFVGDDRGDVAAFSALDRLAAGEGLRVVKVAVASPELPDELAAAADAVVGGPEAVVAMLADLAGALDGTASSFGGG